HGLICFALANSKSASHEHPLKSVRATFVTIPAVTASGIALASVEVIISDGEQSGVPPLPGIAARASTVNGTGAAAGVEYVNPEDAKTPTLGLLAGTTSRHCAQFVF